MKGTPAALVLLALGSAQAASAPAFVAVERAGSYAGPGREEPAPEGLTEVALGWFGPDETDPWDGDLWRAASLALEEANAEGGCRGLPFRLHRAWSSDPWGTGIRELTRLVYDDRAWALIGGVDGATTHLAEQVAVKSRVPLLSPVATDPSVNLANVPWVFSGLPGDDLLAEVLAERLDGASFSLLAATDHDSHAATRALLRRTERAGNRPRLHLEIEDDRADVTAAGIDRVLAAGGDAVVVLAQPEPSARWVLALRERAPRVAILGGASMARRRFLELAGAAADGVVVAAPCDPARLGGEFAAGFHGRFGVDPDCATLQTYDAARVLVEAVGAAGPNRARIADALRGLAPWAGVAGTSSWDPLGRNRRPAHAAVVRDGRLRGAE